MSDIKLLKKPFNMYELRNVPHFVSPYSFIISMPGKLTMICPTEDTPGEKIALLKTCSCFVIEEDDTLTTMSSTNAIASILTNANVDVDIMLMQNKAYIFVDTDKAMSTVMLLTNLAYDVRYVDCE